MVVVERAELVAEVVLVLQLVHGDDEDVLAGVLVVHREVLLIVR